MKMFLLFLCFISLLHGQEVQKKDKELKNSITRSVGLERKVIFSPCNNQAKNEKQPIEIRKVKPQPSLCSEVTAYLFSVTGSLLALQGITMTTSNIAPATFFILSGMCCLVCSDLYSRKNGKI